MKQWFIGDLHFGHEKVAKLRDFDSTNQHDDILANQWRKNVDEGDLVWVLGDISSGRNHLTEERALSIIRMLPGTKRLISGNHDSISSIHRASSPNKRMFYSVFDEIRDFARIRLERQDIFLSHYPYESQGDGPERGPGRYNQYRLRDLGAPLVHAHTHPTHPTNGSVTGREYCVSWDVKRGMTSIGELNKWIKEIS